MLFNSLPFLFAFLPTTWLVFRQLKTTRARYIWLTLTGYVFYGFWNWKFCSLMAFSTAVSYAAGRGLGVAHDATRRRLLLVLPIAVDLLILAYFKYTNFALSSAQFLARRAGVHWTAPTLNVVLPVGISFYTFHTITYVVDCYRGVIQPTRNLFEFSTYVSLFAQLVAGPIVRFRQIESDLDRIGQIEPAWYERGWSFFALGLCKKVLIADTIAGYVDPFFANPDGFSPAIAWICALGYSYQLYFDFSGYSDMATGLGLFFGLRLPQNFDSPYQASDPADFWRRWHISLSSVLRDYLYIPLGGSRGPGWKTYRNLMITMLLGGLWHGANWTFVLWGGYHGLLLCAHRVWSRAWARLPGVVQRAVTFLLIAFGWVFFRAPTVETAAHLLRTMLAVRPGPIVGGCRLVAITAVAAVLAHLAPNTFELSHQWGPAASASVLVLFAASILIVMAGHNSPFLYFQF